jgi:hypothetical protein
MTGTPPSPDIRLSFDGRSRKQEVRYSVCRQYLLAYLCGRISYARLKNVLIGTRRNWRKP